MTTIGPPSGPRDAHQRADAIAMSPAAEVVDEIAGLAAVRAKASKSVATFHPEQTFVRRKALEAVAEAAARLGDIAKLEDAVAEKLEEEAAFAEHIRPMFPHGYGPGRGKKRVDPEVHSFTFSQYVEKFGFKARTVQKWYRLIDDEARKVETAKRVERTWRIVLGESAAHVAQNSGENEWYTPAEYIEAARLGDSTKLEDAVAEKRAEAAA